jgi:hypothetical protein
MSEVLLIYELYSSFIAHHSSFHCAVFLSPVFLGRALLVAGSQPMRSLPMVQAKMFQLQVQD